ncbi:hypothetical protein BDB00DRAFT_866501 [Zychaea mexicana]|uniref:uncharacterized protein n=1 Tax=Zychaea mexicana TaxID=64656 RepID=UPI0022FE75F3|nr:uncharacterized protein BDB00DRAFT_866501 [Zychaea mexicana]KAI9499639.1 hypothetical protein BDB00DRAFT_866501 [Zychaea mexicana]
MVPTPAAADEYLLSLRAVRERCFRVKDAGARNGLQHFDVDPSKLQDVVQFVVALIKRDFDNPSSMPVHGIWRHFETGRPRIQHLLNSWSSLGFDATEQTRRVLDLFVVGVLFDTDADHVWSFREKATGRTHKRAEGVAVAVLELFTAGAFSSDVNNPHRVDSEALMNLSLETLHEGFQVDHERNVLIGLEDRLDLLRHLGQVLQERADFFQQTGPVPRPGNLMDYLLEHKSTIKTKKGALILLETLWPVVQAMGEVYVADRAEGKGGIPSLGDVYPSNSIQFSNNPQSTDHLVPFHKMSQWLVYSIIEPMERLLGATIEGTELLTPLPEFRNGGLLMDTGFISLKQREHARGLENYHKNSLLPGQPKIEVAPMFEMNDPVIIEWRALTTAYLDLVAERVRDVLRLNRNKLTLTRVMDGATWAAGRELAEISRPNTQEPPIIVKYGKFVMH